MARALVVQHEGNDSLGVLGEWALQRGVELEPVRTDLAPPPPPEDFYALVVMGSSASVYDPAVPWIAGELDLVRRAVGAAVPVLGICFGGQLLSAALGGEVTRAPVRELGWYRVESLAPDVLPDGTWWEFHDDRFTVPPGAVELARTAVCAQAFAYGPHLGVQFHPEATAAMHAAWAARRPDQLADLGLDPAALLAADAEHAPGARARASRLFDRFLAGALEGRAVA